MSGFETKRRIDPSIAGFAAVGVLGTVAFTQLLDLSVAIVLTVGWNLGLAALAHRTVEREVDA